MYLMQPLTKTELLLYAQERELQAQLARVYYQMVEQEQFYSYYSRSAELLHDQMRCLDERLKAFHGSCRQKTDLKGGSKAGSTDEADNALPLTDKGSHERACGAADESHSGGGGQEDERSYADISSQKPPVDASLQTPTTKAETEVSNDNISLFSFVMHGGRPSELNAVRHSCTNTTTAATGTATIQDTPRRRPSSATDSLQAAIGAMLLRGSSSGDGEEGEEERREHERPCHNVKGDLAVFVEEKEEDMNRSAEGRRRNRSVNFSENFYCCHVTPPASAIQHETNLATMTYTSTAARVDGASEAAAAALCIGRSQLPTTVLEDSALPPLRPPSSLLFVFTCRAHGLFVLSTTTATPLWNGGAPTIMEAEHTQAIISAIPVYLATLSALQLQHYWGSRIGPDALLLRARQGSSLLECTQHARTDGKQRHRQQFLLWASQAVEQGVAVGAALLTLLTPLLGALCCVVTISASMGVSGNTSSAPNPELLARISSSRSGVAHQQQQQQHQEQLGCWRVWGLFWTRHLFFLFHEALCGISALFTYDAQVSSLVSAAAHTPLDNATEGALLFANSTMREEETLCMPAALVQGFDTAQCRQRLALIRVEYAHLLALTTETSEYEGFVFEVAAYNTDGSVAQTRETRCVPPHLEAVTVQRDVVYLESLLQ